MAGVIPNSNATMLLDDDGDDENNNDAVEKDDNDTCHTNLINDGKGLVRLIERNLTMSGKNSPVRNIADYPSAKFRT